MTARTDVLRVRLEATGDGQVRASLAGVAQGADQVAQSTGTATAATAASADAMKASAAADGELTAALTARGETEEEAIARIHAMVEASLAADEAAYARTLSERELAMAQSDTTAATAEQAAATRALIDAQTEQMAAYTALRAPVRELEALLAQRTLTTADVARAEALLDEAQASGAISAGELNEAFAALDAAKIRDIATTQADTAATVENAAAHINSRTAYSIDALISDAATGQFSRSRREIAALANETGLLSKLMSPLGLGIAAVAATLGVFVIGLVKGEEQTAAFTRAIAANGNAIGATSGQLEDMVQQLGALNDDNYGGAREAILALAQSGKVAATSFMDIGQAALDMSKLTGKSVADSAKELAGLADQPAKALQQYHLLTIAQYDQITALQRQGQQVTAESLAEHDYAQALKQRAQEVQDSAGIIERAGRSIKSAWEGAWNAVDAIGRPDTDAQQLAKLQAKADELKNALITGYNAPINTGHGMIAQPNADPTQTGRELQQVNAAIATLQTKMITQSFTRFFEQDAALANAQALEAQQHLEQFMTPDQALKAAMDKAAQDKTRALYGVTDPAERAKIEAEFNEEVKQAHLAYQRALKHDNPGAAALSSLDRYVGNITATSIAAPGDKDPYAKYAESVAKLVLEYDAAIAKGADATKATQDYAKAIGVLAQNTEAEVQKQHAADEAYGQNLDDQLAARKRAIDLQVQSIGMGSLEVQRLQELNQVTEQFTEKQAQLNRQRDEGSITLVQYDTRLKKLSADENATTQALVEGYARADKARSDWTNGATAAIQDWIDQGNDVAAQTQQMFTDAFGNMTDALVKFVQTGKLDFKSLIDDFIADLVRMELRIIESRILLSIFGAGDGGGFGGVALGGGYNTSSGSEVFGYGAGGGVYAKGGAFDAYGAVTAFATGGIVDKPTLFAFANGTGVMGEAGPEAIMPLTRGPDGKLGVQAQGGGASELQVEVNISNQSGQAVQGKQTGQRRDGQKVIIDMVLQAVAGDMASGGVTAQAAQQRFGLQRRGVPVGG